MWQQQPLDRKHVHVTPQNKLTFVHEDTAKGMCPCAMLRLHTHSVHSQQKAWWPQHRQNRTALEITEIGTFWTPSDHFRGIDSQQDSADDSNYVEFQAQLYHGERLYLPAAFSRLYMHSEPPLYIYKNIIQAAQSLKLGWVTISFSLSSPITSVLLLRLLSICFSQGFFLIHWSRKSFLK